jgi:hypothetical protein
MLKFKLWKLAACLAVLVAGTGRGEAANYRLSDLLQPGAYFDSGDKRFSNFHNFTNPGDNPLDATNIYLSTISQANRNLTDPTNFPLPPGQPACGNQLCPTEYGFRVSGPFDVTQNQHQTYGLDFTVTALGPCKIYAAEQELTAHATNGTADLDTNITAGPVTLAVLGTSVHNPGVNDTLSREYFTSSVTGLPTCATTAHVSMGWVLHSNNVFGAEASINHFDTYFAQAVPEPSTYALLVLGSAGVGLMVRRKQS